MTFEIMTSKTSIPPAELERETSIDPARAFIRPHELRNRAKRSGSIKPTAKDAGRVHNRPILV